VRAQNPYAYDSASPWANPKITALCSRQACASGNILPFWLSNGRNTENRGFFGIIDADMVVKKGAPRGGLLTCRILWSFSAAYRRYRDPSYLELATWAYRDLVDHFLDPEARGLFWTIAEKDGAPKDAYKLIYLQVFGIYALTEYFRVTNDRPAVAKAMAIYHLIEAHARDRMYGGYFDALDRKWSRLRAPRHHALGSAPKSVNFHLHILEAYTNLLRVWADPDLRATQRELLEVLIERFIDPPTHHSILFVSEAWEPVGRGQGITSQISTKRQLQFSMAS
jgi:cellobiose epimerase